MANKKKEIVYLRRRSRKNGNVALFLDYIKNGKRTCEYLKMYLVPENTRDDKRKNAETLKLAEAIKAKRIVDMQANAFGVEQPSANDALFYDYVERLIDRKEGTTKTSWRNCMAHLLRYETNRNLKFKDITPKWVRGFREYLENEATQWAIDTRKRDVDPKPLSQGTKALMFQKLCSVFNSALREGLIQSNPSLTVERFEEPESEREFLTIEELKLLRTVTPPSEALGKAFFFSCLTGLRWSDIIKLRWSEVQQLGNGTRIVFRQKKTGGLEYLDLNAQAAAMLGERAGDDECVFHGLGAIQTARIGVAAWVRSAGINKHITFHCARHTFAVMMLDLGVDLYTVSKLLGHKSIETTQVYAKILDKNKKAAVDRIPNIFG